MSEERATGRWIVWAMLAVGVAFVLYPLSYPWAQCAAFRLELNAAKRGEQPPAWIADAGTKFYEPLGWVVDVIPESALGPYWAYNEWCLKASGIDFAAYIQ
jgi:hypothetical protein